MKLITNLKKYGFKGFMAEWKKGILKITPEQLLRAEISGSIGMIVGSLLAVFFFIWVYDRMWTIAIVMGFNIIIQLAQLTTKYQQLQTFKNFTNNIDISKLFDNVPDVPDDTEEEKVEIIDKGKRLGMSSMVTDLTGTKIEVKDKLEFNVV